MTSKCCVKGCNRYAPYSYDLKLRDGTTIILPYCDNDEHIAIATFGINAKTRRIERFDELREIKALNLKHIEYSNKTKKKIEKKSTIKADKKWEWIEDFGYWMSARNRVVKISTLKDKELEDAVIAIRKNNIKKITKRISWTKEFEEISSPTKYVYPVEKLAQDDIEDAYAKLDEFHEVLAERKLLP